MILILLFIIKIIIFITQMILFLILIISIIIKKIILIIQIILFLKWILLIIINIIILITQIIIFRKSRLKNIGSCLWTKCALVLRHDPRALGPTAAHKHWLQPRTQETWLLTQDSSKMSPDAGSKRIGSWRQTQQNWVLTQDPRAIGSTSEAPKRVIVN